MNPEQIKQYYRKPGIKQAIATITKYKEVSFQTKKSYGPRPQHLRHPGELEHFLKKGAVSFHASVENWKNPHLLTTLPAHKIRTGYDLVIDIDADKGMKYAKKTVLALYDILYNMFNISKQNINIKFSGNRGFHLAIPGNAFPNTVLNTKFEQTYPELPQAIITYLKTQIKPRLAKKFITNKPFNCVDVENDWSHRHMFRLPYSLNEKSWLVSVPIPIDKVPSFKKTVDAQPGNVKPGENFLNTVEKDDKGVESLVQEALIHRKRTKSFKNTGKKRKNKEYTRPENKISQKYFPKPIKNILNGLKDGRKRGLFILITYLANIGYTWDEIKDEIDEWNQKNKEKLDENYIKTQIKWHKNQEKPFSPPNFSTKGWYKDIGVLEQDDINGFDNPIPLTYHLKNK